MKFILKQGDFEGPLELLLELIEKEKLAISDISLAKVTDEYVTYVKQLDRIDPEALAEFLLIAAQLILIKSRSLLPNIQLTDEEETIGDLEKRLTELKRLRDCAQILKAEEVKRRFIVTREPYPIEKPLCYIPPRLTLKKIEDSFLAFLAAIPKTEKLIQEKMRHIVSLQEKIHHIKSFLTNAIDKAFSEIVGSSKEKIDIIVSFLAILELARQKSIEIKQNKLFEEITIKRVSS